MLTIFSTPKTFRGNIKVIQTNAIGSWVALRPACEVILFGNEDGTAEIASKLGIHHILDVECNEYGTPLVSSMFKIAQEIAHHELLCYVNADIILMSDFLRAVQRIKTRPFLLVGQRWDIELPELLDFSLLDWEIKLKDRVKKMGTIHGISGIDYFVFPRELYRNIPSLAVGRPGWDNWMIYHTRSRRVPVIDVTRAGMVVHQDHGSHRDFAGGEKGFWEGPEALRNIALRGGSDYGFGLDYATAILTPRGLMPALTPKYLYYRLRAMTVLHSKLRFLLPLFKTFEKVLIRIRPTLPDSNL